MHDLAGTSEELTLQPKYHDVYTQQTLQGEEPAVLAPTQAFFDEMAKRDKTNMLEVVLAEGGVTITRNSQILQMKIAELMQNPLHLEKCSPEPWSGGCLPGSDSRS